SESVRIVGTDRRGLHRLVSRFAVAALRHEAGNPADAGRVLDAAGSTDQYAVVSGARPANSRPGHRPDRVGADRLRSAARRADAAAQHLAAADPHAREIV